MFIINKKKREKNYAFIDGQNLYLQTDFPIDFKKFRKYLKDKYNVSDAYYFLGFKGDEDKMYVGLQKSGFILMFNDRGEKLESGKKGNIDTNLVFNIMKSLIDDDFGKVVVVSGDGDYIKMIDYLIEKDKFKTIIVPSSNVSSLYRKIEKSFVSKINHIRDKIEYKRKNSHRD